MVFGKKGLVSVLLKGFGFMDFVECKEWGLKFNGFKICLVDVIEICKGVFYRESFNECFEMEKIDIILLVWFEVEGWIYFIM